MKLTCPFFWANQHLRVFPTSLWLKSLVVGLIAWSFVGMFYVAFDRVIWLHTTIGLLGYETIPIFGSHWTQRS